MNPLKALKNAYSALDNWVAARVDRIEGENVARIERQKAYVAEIDRRREEIRKRDADR